MKLFKLSRAIGMPCLDPNDLRSVLLVTAPTARHARVLAKQYALSVGGLKKHAEEWTNSDITSCEERGLDEGRVYEVRLSKIVTYPESILTDKHCALCGRQLFSCPSGLLCKNCGGGVPVKESD